MSNTIKWSKWFHTNVRVLSFLHILPIPTLLCSGNTLVWYLLLCFFFRKASHCTSDAHPKWTCEIHSTPDSTSRRARRWCGLRCWAVATAAIRHGGPWVPGSDAILVPASLSLSDAMANGRASKLALISSARSVHRSAALRWACPSAYANGREPKLARVFVF